MLNVRVVYAPAPHAVEQTALALADGSTVADALRASGVVQRHGLDEATLVVGVWGKLAEPGRTLREGDRVELYRPLTVDPKEARRQRYRKKDKGKKDQGTTPR